MADIISINKFKKLETNKRYTYITAFGLIIGTIEELDPPTLIIRDVMIHPIGGGTKTMPIIDANFMILYYPQIIGIIPSVDGLESQPMGK